MYTQVLYLRIVCARQVIAKGSMNPSDTIVARVGRLEKVRPALM